MDERIERLNEIAQHGNIDAFYIKIREDVKILEHIDELPFVDTPLHIFAYNGHVPFSIEMMKLKLSFVSKLNPDGHSPIHLALINGCTEIVYQLLQHKADLVLLSKERSVRLLCIAQQKQIITLIYLRNFYQSVLILLSI